MCPKLIELLSWNGPTVHVCCFMLARASTKTFVSRIHIGQQRQKNSEKILRQLKNSLAGSLVSRDITVQLFCGTNLRQVIKLWLYSCDIRRLSLQIGFYDTDKAHLTRTTFAHKTTTAARREGSLSFLNAGFFQRPDKLRACIES